MNNQEKTFGYKVAIFDPNTIHGKRLRKVLLERNFPIETMSLLDTEDSSGALTAYDDEAVLVMPANDENLEKQDVVFFCGKPEVAAGLIKQYEKLSFYPFDLCSSMLESEVYRYFVDDVDKEVISTFPGVFANPHSVAIPLVKILSRLNKEFGLKSAVSTVMTSVSEDGLDGISELHKQTAALLNFSSVDGRQKVFNVYPHEDTSEQKEKLIEEQVRKITGLEKEMLKLVLFDTPVFFGNHYSLYVELDKAPGKSFKWKNLFNDEEGFSFDGVISEGKKIVSPVEIADTDRIHIQIVKAETDDLQKLWLWVLSDNIRLGSVINAVKLAEIALEL